MNDTPTTASIWGCTSPVCEDVHLQKSYAAPLEFNRKAIRVVMISESASLNPQDGYYAGESSLYARTTLEAFRAAGFPVSCIDALLGCGIYLTCAVKCAKMAYGIKPATIKACAGLLEQELAQFPNLSSLLLMGDVAIKAINLIAQRQELPRVIPAASTYKIRGGEFYYRQIRAFPSYLQAGPSFYIEKVKRKMIAEDIAAALRWAKIIMV